jgi:ribosomal protein L14
MIGLKGRMVVIDNSGATLAECVNVLKVKTRKKSTGFGTVGAYAIESASEDAVRRHQADSRLGGRLPAVVKRGARLQLCAS